MPASLTGEEEGFKVLKRYLWGIFPMLASEYLIFWAIAIVLGAWQFFWFLFLILGWALGESFFSIRGIPKRNLVKWCETCQLKRTGGTLKGIAFLLGISVIANLIAVPAEYWLYLIALVVPNITFAYCAWQINQKRKYLLSKVGNEVVALSAS